MLKLIGAVLIITATTFGGFHMARGYYQRSAQLRMLQLGLQMLETEIVYGSVSLHIAMKKIGARLKGPVANIFLTMSENLAVLDGITAYECWVQAIDKHIRQTSLKNQDQEILIHFGQTLGMSDREDQIKHIKLAIENLKAEEKMAREEQGKYEKLSKSLGVLLGLLIVILMY